MTTVFTYSEVGGHAVNEDAFGVRSHPADEHCLLIALADGQGGQAGGGRAAQLATQSVLEWAAGYSPSSVSSANYWPSLLRLADQAVSNDSEAGYTTLIGLAIRGNSLAGASSGDSAVLAINNNGRAVKLTHGQHKNPPVGSHEAFFVPFTAKLIAPWIVVAMSDGVWKYVGWDRVREKVSSLRGQELIDSLQQSARLPGSGRFQDDFTVIVIQDCE